MSFAVAGRQPFFSASFTWCTRVAKQYAVAGLGISPPADGGNVPRPAAGQEGRHQGFYPLNSHFLLGGSDADCRHVTAAKQGNGREFFLPCLSQSIRRVGYITATQTGYSPQAQHTRVAQLVSLEITDGTCGFRRLIDLSSQVLSIITCLRIARHCYAAPA